MDKHERSILLLSKIKYHVTSHMENCSSSASKKSDWREDKTALAGTLLEVDLLVCWNSQRKSISIYVTSVNKAAWEQEITETPFSSSSEMEQAASASVMLNSKSLSTFQNIIISKNNYCHLYSHFQKAMKKLLQNWEDTQSYFDSIYKILARPLTANKYPTNPRGMWNFVSYCSLESPKNDFLLFAFGTRGIVIVEPPIQTNIDC